MDSAQSRKVIAAGTIGNVLEWYDFAIYGYFAVAIGRYFFPREDATPIRNDGDSGEWQDWLVDEVSDQETRLVEDEETDNRRKALGEALSVLNDRERRIFEARRLADDPITLEDLAAEFGVSRERVRQIEVRAFEKVQKAVKSRVAAMETPAETPAITAH